MDFTNKQKVGNNAVQAPVFSSENPLTIDRNPQNLGNLAANAAENNIQIPDEAFNQIAEVAELGKVTNLEMPPNMPKQGEKSVANIVEQSMSYEAAGIKTDDHLSKHGMQQVVKIQRDLDKTEDIAAFYEAARDMMEDNLKNSYNRKLAS